MDDGIVFGNMGRLLVGIVFHRHSDDVLAPSLPPPVITQTNLGINAAADPQQPTLFVIEAVDLTRTGPH